DTCVSGDGTITRKGNIGKTKGTYNVEYTVTDIYGTTSTLTKPFILQLDTTIGNYGDVVYYDPVNDVVECTTYTESNSASGVIEGCLKWHVLSENADGSVNLILDHNIVSGVTWHGTDNAEGPTVAKEALNNAIKDKWSANLVRTDSYSHTFNNGTENKTYTVSYNGMKARLPEAGEIANSVGNTTWNEDTAASSKYFYFDSKNRNQTVGYGKKQTTSSYAWLFNNLGGGASTNASSASTCLYYGCTMAKANSSGEYAYWTSTSSAGSSSMVWRVGFVGTLDSGDVAVTNGVRPVISLNPSIFE
ncbi:MAG: hypothetical protein IJZ36_03100, partial [Bacilli bacterium]|nr:hypothetical protein [Bacilli bacterium]